MCRLDKSHLLVTVPVPNILISFHAFYRVLLIFACFLLLFGNVRQTLRKYLLKLSSHFIKIGHRNIVTEASILLCKLMLPLGKNGKQC